MALLAGLLLLASAVCVSIAHAHAHGHDAADAAVHQHGVVAPASDLAPQGCDDCGPTHAPGTGAALACLLAAVALTVAAALGHGVRARCRTPLARPAPTMAPRREHSAPPDLHAWGISRT